MKEVMSQSAILFLEWKYQRIFRRWLVMKIGRKEILQLYPARKKFYSSVSQQTLVFNKYMGYASLGTDC